MDEANLIQLVTGGDSCGEDLEADERFRQLESEIGSDATDWQAVEALALDLLAKSVDIRVMVGLAAASLRDARAGLGPFRIALHGLASLIEKHGDRAHPEVSADDPVPGLRARRMAIEELGSEFGTVGDDYEIVAKIRQIPITSVGETFTVRDVMILRGEIANAQVDPEEVAGREAAFQKALSQTLDGDRGSLERLGADARGCLEEISKIETLFSERVADVTGVPAPDLEALQDQLTRVAAEVEGLLPDAASAVAPGVEAAVADATEPSATRGSPPVAGAPGAIRSRADVLAALEAIQQYYRSQEPSSPVPLLLQRASRFVNMSFVDIVHDIAGDSVDNMRVVFGSEGEDS